MGASYTNIGASYTNMGASYTNIGARYTNIRCETEENSLFAFFAVVWVKQSHRLFWPLCGSGKEKPFRFEVVGAFT